MSTSMRTGTLIISLVLIVVGFGYGLSVEGQNERLAHQTIPDQRAPVIDATTDRAGALSDSLRTMLQSRSVSNGVIFDNASLNGAYAFSSAGGESLDFFGDFTTTITRIGLWSFDGQGNFTRMRSATTSTGGFDPDRSFTGTYSVEPLGDITLRFSTGFTCAGIVTDGGAGFVFLCADPFSNEAGYARKQ